MMKTPSENIPICPIDNSIMSFDFRVPKDWRKPNVNQHFDVYKCKKCNFKQIYPRPSKEEVSTFYQLDDYYTHKTHPNNNQKNKISLISRIRQHLSYRLDFSTLLNESLLDKLGVNKNAKICEIGCGNGAIIKLLKEFGYKHVIGVEIDPAAIEACIKNGLDVIIGTAEEIPEKLQSEKFDVIILCHVFEHCLSPDIVLKNIHKISKDNGLLIIEVPNNQCIGAKISGLSWPWLDIPRHLNFFAKSNLTMLLNKHNFKIKNIQFTGYNRQFTNDWIDMQKLIAARLGIKSNLIFNSWFLLILSGLSPKRYKYDSIRIVATSKS